MKDKYKNYNQKKYNTFTKKLKMSGKESILNTLKCLFSNQAAIDGRNKPIYFVVIVAIILMVIAWIPSIATGYTQKSASFLSGVNNNGVDHGFKMLFNETYFEAIKVDSIDKKGVFTFDTKLLDEESNSGENSITSELEIFDNNKTLAKGLFIDSENPNTNRNGVGQIIVSNKNVTKNFSNKEHVFYTDSLRSRQKQALNNNIELAGDYQKNYTVYLEVYLIPGLKSTDEGFATYQANFLSSVFYRLNDQGLVQKYLHSFILICDDCLRIVTYPINNVSKSSSAYGNFIGYTKDTLKNVSNKTLKSYLNGAGTRLNDNEMYDSLINFFNDTAFSTNVKNAWINVGILSGVAFGSYLLCGTFIFLMERRKTSIVKANYLEGIIQGVNICTTPALLSLIGFMSTVYGIIAFAGFALLRVVFMGSKISPPQVQDESKPLYKART